MNGFDDHGQSSNLTMSDLQVMSSINLMSPPQSVENITTTFDSYKYKRITIVSDIDGTIGDTMSAYSLALKLVYNSDILPRNWTSYKYPDGTDKLKEIMHDPALLLRLSPFYDIINVLNWAYEIGHVVIIATDREPSLKKITKQWLDYAGVKYHDLRVGKGNKESLCRVHNTDNPMLLIDDNSEKWVSCNVQGTTILSPRRPYTPDNSFHNNVIVYDNALELISYIKSETMNE